MLSKNIETCLREFAKAEGLEIGVVEDIWESQFRGAVKKMNSILPLGLLDLENKFDKKTNPLPLVYFPKLFVLRPNKTAYSRLHYIKQHYANKHEHVKTPESQSLHDFLLKVKSIVYTNRKVKI